MRAHAKAVRSIKTPCLWASAILAALAPAHWPWRASWSEPQTDVTIVNETDDLGGVTGVQYTSVSTRREAIAQREKITLRARRYLSHTTDVNSSPRNPHTLHTYNRHVTHVIVNQIPQRA